MKVRVIYSVTRERKEIFRLGDGNYIWGAERKSKPLYKVKDNVINVFVPVFGDFKDFELLKNGYVAPGWKCKTSIIKTMFWLPENYHFIIVNNIFESPWYDEENSEFINSQFGNVCENRI